MTPGTKKVLIILLVVAACLVRGVDVKRHYNLCTSDFPVFYAGGKLVGNAGLLYSADAVQAIHREVAGCDSPSSIFVRLPSYAVFLWPLAQLPFTAAYVIWQALAVAAMIGCILLWPADWKVGLLACVWSFPIGWSLVNGQDMTFVLLCLAAGIWFVEKDRSFLGGVLLSLCSLKFHLFVFVPLLLVLQKRWTAVKGLALGGVVLGLICFAAGGWDWPVSCLRAIEDPRIDPQIASMANIRGMLGGAQPILEIALAGLIATVVAYIGKRATFPIGLCAALVGGLLVSHHMSPSDLALLIPVALTMIRELGSRWLRLLTLVLVALAVAIPPRVEVVLMMVWLGGAALELIQDERARLSPFSRAELAAEMGLCPTD